MATVRPARNGPIQRQRISRRKSFEDLEDAESCCDAPLSCGFPRAAPPKASIVPHAATSAAIFISCISIPPRQTLLSFLVGPAAPGLFSGRFDCRWLRWSGRSGVAFDVVVVPGQIALQAVLDMGWRGKLVIFVGIDHQLGGAAQALQRLEHLLSIDDG